MPRSSVRVRLTLLGIFALLALGFVVSPGRAQPGRPPGFPSTPPRPNFPTMPAIPTPPRPNFPAMPSPPTFGPSRNEWVCSGCRFVVGTGPVRPNVTTCPGCGARFNNPGIGAPNGAAPNAGGGAPMPAAPNAAEVPNLLAPELPTNPAAGQPNATDSPPAGASAPTTAAPPVESAAPAAEPEPRKGRGVLIAVLVGGGLLVFGAMGVLAFVVMKANAPQKARHRPKRRALELD